MIKQTHLQTPSSTEQTVLEIQVVVLGSIAAFDALQQLFAQAQPSAKVRRAETIPAALDASSQGVPVLVIHKAPERALAEMLEQGVAPSEATRSCHETLEQLLGVVRKVRSRVLLLDETSLLDAPHAIVEKLEQRLNIELSAASPSVDASPQYAAELALFLTVAHYILKKETQLRSFSDQIGAMTVGTEDASTVDLESLDQAFASRKMQGENGKDLAEEKALLVGYVGQMEETIRTLKISAEEADKERVNTVQAVAEVSQTSTGLAEKDALEAECARLRENIAQMRNQVEQGALESDLQRKHLAAVEEKAAMAVRQGQEREATLGATILRLGHVGDAETAANIQLRENNKGLHGRVKTLEEECAEQADKLKQAFTQHSAHETQITADKDALQQALDNTRAELDHVYNSKSWKAATALRNVRHGFKK